MGAALDFWKRVVHDKSNFLERIFELLESNQIAYCVIGGTAVNAYAEPVLTLDVDIAIVLADIPRFRALAEAEFRVREFEHSLDVYDPGSNLQVRVQLSPQMAEIVPRAQRMDVLDLMLPVAAPSDLLRLKIDAATEPRRRRSKQGKDFMDIARLIGEFPGLEDHVPTSIRDDVNRFRDIPE